MALRELILAGEKYRRAATAHLGVTVSESQAISYLTARGPMGLTELAGALHMTTGAVTTMIDRLEDSGLARRRPHPTDRRRLTVELTAKARSGVATTRTWLRQAVTDAADDDLDDFTTVVMTLAHSLAEQAGRATTTEPIPPRDPA